MNFFKIYFFIPFCVFIKSKSVLNRSGLYNNNSFEQINNLYENKTQLKHIFVSLNNVPYLKLIKHDNNNSIIFSKNLYFLSSKKNTLRKIEENDIENDTDENDDTNEDSESNEEIFEEIKKNVSKYYNNNSNIQNLTIIKFGNNTSSSSDFFLDILECESILKQIELINSSSSLYILQIEINREDEVVNQFEYSIYLSNGTKVNLSLCSGTKVNITTSINKTLVENYEKAFKIYNKYGYDIFNVEDPFYIDICSIFTSDNETDVTLDDRKKDYYLNISFCEENCSYIHFDYYKASVTCQCNIKEEIDLNYTNFSYFNFTKVKTNYFDKFNFKVYKCYNQVFSITRLKGNIGSYIIISVLIFEIVLLFLFCGVGLIPSYELVQIILRKQTHIDELILKKIDGSTSNINFIGNNNLNLSSIHSYKKKRNMDVMVINENINKNNNLNINEKNVDKCSSMALKKNIDIKSKKTNLEDEIINKNIVEEIKNENIDNMINVINNGDKLLNQNINNSNKNNIQNEEKIKKMKDIELNKLPFEKAIIHDKRNFFQYYYSQIKYSHIFIFTFLISIDGNARIIKLFLFMFYISLSLFFNIFFFEKKNISYIYQNKGKMDYFYSIEKPIISAFVVEIILIFFKLLALDNIRNFRSDIKEFNKYLCKAKTKIGIFFMIQFILLICFWYIIAAFCAIFFNTQLYLIKDCIISIVFYMFIPFFTILLSSIFRIIGLKKKKKILYNISKFFTLF